MGSEEQIKRTANSLASTGCDINDLDSFMKFVPKCTPTSKFGANFLNYLIMRFLENYPYSLHWSKPTGDVFAVI